MSGSRASIYDSEEIDVSGFAPKPAGKDPAKRPAPSPAEVKAVSEEARFPSRQPTIKAKLETAPAPAPAKRANRQYRTGRNVQFNVKVSQETLDAFYRVADAQSWVLGETLARAIAALTRELDAPP